MAKAGEIKARLTLENENFKRGMQNAREEMKNTSTSAKNTAQSLDVINKGALALGAAVVAGIGTSTKIAANFEQAMARVKAVSGATDVEFSQLEKTAKQLGETTQFSASQVAEGMSYLAMAGFEVNQIVASMPGVLSLASAAQLDLGRSSDIVSNILTGFKLSAEETDRAVDVLVKTMTTANTDLPQLGEAMKYVAPIASSLGLSIEETAAAVAKLSDAGIQGSQAGTALRAALLSLANPTGQTSKAMEALKINIKDANGEMLPFPELVGHIAERMNGLTDAQKTQYAAQLVGTEAASGFLTLLEIGEVGLRDYTKELKNSAGTAQQVAKIQNDTVNGAFKEFQSALEGVGIKIGNEYLPKFREIIKYATELVRWFGELNPQTVAMGLNMAGTAAGIALAATTLIRLGTAIRGLYVAMGPTGWLILALSVLGGLFVGLTTATEENRKVNLESAKAMMEQERALNGNIERYEALRAKATLTNDQLARFLDIQTEMRSTTDPEVLASLREEQERLAKMSGLTNDELSELISLNHQLVETLPQSDVVISEHGNVLLKNTDALRDLNAQQRERIRLELEMQLSIAKANYSDHLKEEKKLKEEINQLREKHAAIDLDIIANQNLLFELDQEYRAAVEDGDARRIALAKTSLDNQKLYIEGLHKEKGTIIEQIIAKEDSLGLTQAELNKVKEIEKKMIDIELAQVGINNAKDDGVQKLNEEIFQTKSQIRELERQREQNKHLNHEYDEMISKAKQKLNALEDVRGRVKSITREADVLNSTLGRSISKNVHLNYSNTTVPIRLQYHQGGTVGKQSGTLSDLPIPKLHSGGLPSWLSEPPAHNEMDVRVLRREMILTEAQQAQLFNQLNSPSGGGSGAEIDALNRVVNLLSLIEKKTGENGASIYLDGQEIAYVMYDHLDKKQKNEYDTNLSLSGVRL